jgi:hypothetical protein
MIFHCTPLINNVFARHQLSGINDNSNYSLNVFQPRYHWLLYRKLKLYDAQ